MGRGPQYDRSTVVAHAEVGRGGVSISHTNEPEFFSKNKWSNQNFRKMYIGRRTPQPWGTTLGVTPTVGCTGRWGQVPAAVGHGGMIPSVVAHGGKALASWSTAAAPRLYKGSSPSRRPLPHSSKPSAFNPSEHFWGMFLNLVHFI
jgi:hypothetical protein